VGPGHCSDNDNVAYGAFASLIVDAAVDNSGSVDAVDVQMVVNAALGVPSDVKADLNRDGGTDAVDIQIVVNSALGVNGG